MPAGNFIRVSAKTRSWENAERKARLLEINTEATRGSSPAPNLSSAPGFIRSSIPEPNPRITQEASPGITIEQAVRGFLEDEETRRLAKTTTSQSKTLFEKQLLKWARDESLKFLEELTTARLRNFRASWNKGAMTTQRKHHRLNGFFDFCIESDWIHKNPSKKMKAVQVSSDPTDYFTPAEFEKIFRGCIAVPACSMAIRRCTRFQIGSVYS